MANYQLTPNFNLNHGGENDNATKLAGASHLAQHVQGAMGDTLAHPLPTQTSAANEAVEAIGATQTKPQHRAGVRRSNHARIDLSPTHTCADCKQTYPNNYALEKHAAEERHKAYLCACTTKFVRLATLNRHIAAQDGPKHHCIYCDGNKGFARQDKLIDHLRASHKFGDNAIAHFRNQVRGQPQGNGHASSEVATTGTALPVSTLASYNAAPGGTVGQAGYSAGPSAGPFGIVDGGIADFPMFSAAELQPFGSIEDYPLFDASEDFMDFDFSGLDLAGVDFTGVNGDLDMSGMDNIF